MANIQGKHSKYLVFTVPQKPHKVKAFRNLMVNQPIFFPMLHHRPLGQLSVSDFS